ncbi:MAG: hypothetical protein GYB31_03055 [Bacteroidetes bacterium]|nr:hypothetical protein [Bacteroidota bacterium]
MKNLTLLLLLSTFMLTSCFEEPGCTDPAALNYEYDATENDGSCQYSDITFYSKYGYYAGVPISKIDVIVEGSSIGAVTAVYPNGPGNCSAQGNILYSISAGETVNWNAEITLVTGAVFFASGGSVKPSSSQECIKVNVAN